MGVLVILFVAFVFGIALSASGHSAGNDLLRMASIFGLWILILGSIGACFGAGRRWLLSPSEVSTEIVSKEQSRQSRTFIEDNPKFLSYAAVVAIVGCGMSCYRTIAEFGAFNLVLICTITALIFFLKVLISPTKRIQWFAALIVALLATVLVFKNGFSLGQIGLPIAVGTSFVAVSLLEPKREKTKVEVTIQSPMTTEQIAAAIKGPGFDAVAGMSELKSKLISSASEAVRVGTKQIRNGVLLYGEPGNGKTYIVEALAEQMGLPLVTMTYGDVGSMWVGETTENVLAKVNVAKRSAPCILFIDEADSLLSARGGSTSSKSSITGDQDRTVNTLLTEIVNLRGSGVVVVAATNYLDKLDAAAIREGRFDFKIEITPPDLPARIALLQTGVQRYANEIHIDDTAIISAATRWNGFSAKRILGVAEQIPSYAARTGKSILNFDDLKAVLREVQGIKAAPPEGTKTLDELVLPEDQRQTLLALAKRLEKSFEIEQAGGSLPSGLLFSGPPGTGKTETARALAKSSGWAFLSTSGTDLIIEPSKMDKMWKDAMNARPAIIFVDEVDDLLMNRECSQHRLITNKFLTVVDGPTGKVPDVLWIAATNYPERLDKAALRGGRFTEKVEFAAPEESALANWIEKWLRTKGWTSSVSAKNIAKILDGQSVANVTAILQQSINAALTKSLDMSVRSISVNDFDCGVKAVLGESA